MTREGIAATTFLVAIVTDWRLSDRNAKRVAVYVLEVIEKVRNVFRNNESDCNGGNES